MHEYQRFVQREMNARNWNQNDVARHAGLNRQTISAIMKDEREKLNQLPDSKTIDGLARAFTVSREVVLAHVALAMGLPVKLERADVSTASNDELVSELARRLKAGEDNASTSHTRAAGSAAKANVHELFTDPPAEEKSVAWRTRNRDKEAQERQDADAERPDD